MQRRMRSCLSILLFAPALLATTPSPTGPITVTLSPATAVLRLQGKMNFTATVSGATTNRTVYWRVNGVTGGNVVVGTISTSGAYQAPPAMPNGGYVDVSAVSNADPTKIGTVRVTLQNPIPTLGSIQPSSMNYNLATVIVAKGTGFVRSSQIVVNGVAQTTTFVSTTELSANYRPITPAGSTLTVLVRNPNPGGADTGTKTIPVLGPVIVSVSPENKTIRGGATIDFNASIQNTSNKAVDWFVNGVKGGTTTIGLIDANGLYQAPPLAPVPNVVSIKATSQFDARGTDTVQLTVLNPVPEILSTSPTGLRTGLNTFGITGKGLAKDITVTLNNIPVPVTWMTPTQIRITANVAPSLGGYAVLRATNPNPGGTSSAPYNIEVVIKPGLMPEGSATRFLEQATWGPSPDSVARLVEIGRDQWLTEQFAMPPSAYDDPESESQGLTKLRRNFFRNALRGPDQLRQRVAWALGQIFVISGNELEYYWQHVPYVRMLNQHAFSNYREIMERVALSPAMGEYLDMVNNAKPDPVKGFVPNENFGRELLQLFTIGLTKLNPDGTRQTDAQGMPVPAYSEEEIKQLSLALTGWTYPPRPGFTSKWKNPPYYLAEMVPFEQHHDQSEKNFLGQRVNAGQTAQQDLERALDIIFAHPNVGPFVAYRMIQRLVTANPTPAYVGRVAAAFNNNGSGVRGDMRAVVRAVLTDAEAGIIKPDQGHLREPVLFVTTLLRALNTTVTDFPALDGFTREMSQDVFTPPSVFNYFSPFFRLMPANIPSPEFQIYNPTTALERVNFAYRASRNNLGSSISVPVDHFAAVADDPPLLLTAVSKALMRGGLPADMRASILTALQSTNDTRERARMAIYLVASSSRFSVLQ